MQSSELPQSQLPQLDEDDVGAARRVSVRICIRLVDGALLLSRHCGDPLAAATCLASQHLFSRLQFEFARRTRSSFARRANAARRTSLLQRLLMSLGVVMSKDFWLTCACAEEVKRVMAASCGAGRPKKSNSRIKNQSRDVSDLLRWVGCGPFKAEALRADCCVCVVL